MKTYNFSRTLADGTKKIETVEAESLTQALAIYRQRIRDES